MRTHLTLSPFVCSVSVQHTHTHLSLSLSLSLCICSVSVQHTHTHLSFSASAQFMFSAHTHLSLSLCICSVYVQRARLQRHKKSMQPSTRRFWSTLCSHLQTSFMEMLTSFSNRNIAHAHSAKTTFKWFADHDITVLDWPANIPDLNPIWNL